MIIALQDRRILDWAQARLHCRFDDECKTISSVDDDGGVLAVVIYERITRHDCLMHVSSTDPRWCSKPFLRAAFTYPFVQLGLERVTFVVSEENEEAMALCERLGAKREGRLRRGFGDADGIVWGLLWS